MIEQQMRKGEIEEEWAENKEGGGHARRRHALEEYAQRDQERFWTAARAFVGRPIHHMLAMHAQGAGRKVDR